MFFINKMIWLDNNLVFFFVCDKLIFYNLFVCCRYMYEDLIDGDYGLGNVVIEVGVVDGVNGDDEGVVCCIL